MKKTTLTTAILAAAFSMGAAAAELELTYTKLWTFKHETQGQFGEIPAYDSKTNTIWVAGVVGVDVLDAETGTLAGHIDVTPHGFVNSVAIHNGLAALAIEARSTPTEGDRRGLGSVLFYDTRTRSPIAGVNKVPVGSLPDMLTFTHDGRKLLVANEATPNRTADSPYVLSDPLNPDPPGTVSIIDVAKRSVVATAGFAGVPTSGSNLRTQASVGMDFEPEYIAVDLLGLRAYVTLQEANALGVLDLRRNAFTNVIGLGAKDFNRDGNEIDPNDQSGVGLFEKHPTAKGLYMPDSVALYHWLGIPFLVMANEGDFREDNADRARGSDFGAAPPAPLNRLRVSNRDSSSGNLFAAGARSFSIRGTDGALIWDSGSTLDREAHMRGIYSDGRSADKGVEPEGIALLDLGFRTYAFIGLERTTKSAVAIFDISNPWKGRFLDMIVTDGDLAPEGLEVYHHRGRFYLAISNETPIVAGATSNTTLYGLDLVWSHGDD